MNTGKDAIYSQPQQVGAFTFDQNVAEVFPDMIQRSVPGYSTIVDAIGQLCGRHAKDNSRIYDLGCSLGAVSLAASKYVQAQNSQIIAIDNSEAMAKRCELHVQAFKSTTPIKVICDDLQNVEIKNASCVVMNFTLQFIPPEQRKAIIEKIYAGLDQGGILILSEKLKHDTEQGNELLIDLHHEFKRRNGYSDLEISQKRTALEDVMRTDTFEQHQSRLTSAGFIDVIRWFTCFNFASMVAIKG
ncbi:carboxy-S-adenosyl-L-methionine synthase CmoA [Paraglaciecola aquimarina]|uniref:Carboxy-S-adenosyl-L-methionine synthase n=1 Tax=Paraglaciecola aquimarina TaxID=1235557 RepID=A0ABU3SY65_9ALTE|nr:carboxy-S-adenosyl-L-methionine synthase CmoA [Paraglaciecola aquimarina]MDU0354949.1 carboxy-S-adenosyl-L-methionine synthase CmoA [Paraglaciecola aquimarina]